MERAAVVYRREKIEYRRWFLFNIFAIISLFALSAESVFAAAGDQIDTIANPAGTTIDFFDYWIYDNNNVSTSPYYGNNKGINENHDLWFLRNSGDSNPNKVWNEWTRAGGGARQGIVQPLLGDDGYPVLAVGNQKSLAYLFDHSDITDSSGNVAKKAYTDVNNLFSVDEDFNYLFDSDTQKAVLDRDAREISVYEYGQNQKGFWPFSNGVKPSNNSPDGYFFGAHIHSDFSIPYDGKVLNGAGEYNDMVYKFTGDDDVWVFIDGILIGDVGGIHDTEGLDINFVTGDVMVYNVQYPNKASTTFKTTIYDMVVAAIGEEEAQNRFLWKTEEDGTYKTFAGSTYHTLDFFYLERGAGESNMEMRYNLVSTYDFGAHKALYSSNSEQENRLTKNQFRYKLSGYPITDDEGHVIFEAVMPKNRPDPDVYWEANYDTTKLLTLENMADDPAVKELIAGNSADGNINFGSADLNGSIDDQDTEFGRYVGQTFRYIVEELPPEGAVLNDDGTYSYNGEVISPNSDGTYTFDGIVYDNTKYYYEGTVSQQGWINKTYYTDDTFTTKADVSFPNFSNLYNSFGRAVFTAYKKYYTSYDELIRPMEPRQFYYTLTDVSDPDAAAVIQNNAGNDGNGKVTFSQILYTLAENMPAGETETYYTYKIEENPLSSDTIVSFGEVVYYARVFLTDNYPDPGLGVEIRYYKDADCTAEVPADQVIFKNKNNAIGTLTVDKTVAGNIGSKNKTFDFTLSMADMAGQSAQYSLDGGETRSDLTFSESGEWTFSLKHDQSITFFLVHGDFTVTETTDDGGYVTAWHSSADPDTETTSKAAEGTITDDQKTISFTNTLDVTPPTGVRDPLGPALAGIASAFLMLFLLLSGKKERRND